MNFARDRWPVEEGAKGEGLGPGDVRCRSRSGHVRRFRFGSACTLLLTVSLGSLAPANAGAKPMDPALPRLVLDPACETAGAVACVPDRAAYAKLVSQLGFALAPQSAYEARTTGLSGFQVALLGGFTAIQSSADYWKRGTQGNGGAAENADPDAWLQLYSLEVRKGFGFGIEAAASLGVMPNTSLINWGAELRLALLEGRRTGALRYLPDTSLGVALREATGLPDLALGTLAVDARISQPLISASGFIVTPWLGYQWLRIEGNAAAVDATPERDALAECGYSGSNQPGTLDASATTAAAAPRALSGAPASVYDGAPVCRNALERGAASDLANTLAFGQAEVLRQRLLLGVSYRRELLRLGAELITDLERPDAAQSDAAVASALRCDSEGVGCRPSARQWTLVLQVGAAF